MLASIRRSWNISNLMFVTLALLICVADRSPIHLTQYYTEGNIADQFMAYYDGMIAQTLPGPYIYRVLVPLSVYLIGSVFTFVGPITIDFALKVIILLACQATMFRFCQRFHSRTISVIGVLIFDVLTCYALFYIQGPSLIETGDLLTTLVILLSLIALEDDKPWLLGAILFIGTLNRETTWFVAAIFIIHEISTARRWSLMVVILASVAIPYFTIRWLHGSMQPWFTAEGVADNLPFLGSVNLKRVLVSNVRFFIMILPIGYLAAKGRKSGPLYLRIALACVPIFIIVHYFVGGIIETRLWIPLLPILIPLGLFTWSRELSSELKKSPTISF